MDEFRLDLRDEASNERLGGRVDIKVRAEGGACSKRLQRFQGKRLAGLRHINGEGIDAVEPLALLLGHPTPEFRHELVDVDWFRRLVDCHVRGALVSGCGDPSVFRVTTDFPCLHGTGASGISLPGVDPTSRITTYLALAELAGRWRSQGAAREPRGDYDLTASEMRVFSQNGEDGVIEAIFDAVGIESRSFVEFGAERGLEGNCVFLAEVLGWRGLFIEADPAAFAMLDARYRDRPRVVTTCAAVTAANINEIVDAAGFAGPIDVVSIDIDSHDYWVWEALTAVDPTVVVIEYNAHIRYPEARVQPLHEGGPWQGTDYFGASLGALEYLGKRKGYELVHTDLAGVNAFFVRTDRVADLPTGDAVPRRSPNFFLSGMGHPPDDSGRTWVDPTEEPTGA